MEGSTASYDTVAGKIQEVHVLSSKITKIWGLLIIPGLNNNQLQEGNEAPQIHFYDGRPD